jgi:hypothetical protein
MHCGPKKLYAVRMHRVHKATERQLTLHGGWSSSAMLYNSAWCARDTSDAGMSTLHFIRTVEIC